MHPRPGESLLKEDSTMIPKMPPREGQLGFLYLPPYRVQGVSVAGEQTVVQIPELDIVFDMGQCTRASLSSGTVALSHAHMDHLGGLPYWLSQRHFQKLGCGRIVCHPELVGPLERMIQSWVDLEQQKTPFEITPLPPGEDLQLKSNLVLRSFETKHTAPSLAYAIVEKRSKLKPDYCDLPQDRIKELKSRGTDITTVVEIPTIAITGDTEPCSALETREFREAKMVLTECTFFSPEHKDRAKIGRHIHLDDLAALLNEWEADNVVITHISRRTSLGFARDRIKEIEDGRHNDRVHILMDYRTNRRRYEQQAAEAGLKSKKTLKQ